jgi:transposase
MYKRNKYNYELRVQCVELVLKGERSVLEIARQKGVELSYLRLWVRFYEKYGKAGLMPRVKQQYTPAFKQRVLDTIVKERLSLRAACVRFNILSTSVLLRWRRAYECQGQVGLIPKRKGRSPKMKQPIKRKQRKSTKPLTREEELLRENEYLRAENELLKKLQALVQTNKKQKP